MDKNNPVFTPHSQNALDKLLKDKVQGVFASQNLESQRRLVEVIAAELNITTLDCAAALVYLNEGNPNKVSPNNVNLSKTSQVHNDKQSGNEKPLLNNSALGIRLVRYRLDVGFQHKVTLDDIKKVLVEESGVDIKNIVNVRIQDGYTLIDLPDEMPQEIFHHLKTVEINEQKLDIRRVKPRNKKRGNRMHRRARSVNLLPTKEVSK
jgi:DbpA RNA binding domain